MLFEDVSRIARDALIEEPLVWPRFGLVGGDDDGAHADMSYPLLVSSARALRPYFEESVAIGFAPIARSGDGFALLRARGVVAEREMLAATRGINTHKGAVFLLGMLLHAWARALRLRHRRGDARGAAIVTASEVLDEAYRGAYRPIEAELRAPRLGLSQTYGEWALARYGWRGVRGVVQDRFRLLSRGLQAYRRHRHLGRAVALGHLRHYFFAHGEDTNLVKRAGFDNARRLREASRALLAKGGIRRPRVAREVAALERRMVQSGWSAAGAGDMVAAAIVLIDLCEKGYCRAA